MKIPDTTVDFPFNFNVIVLKFQPNLWDEKQTVSFRGLRFVLLYMLSFGVGMALIFIPIALLTETFIVPFFMWLIASVVFGGTVGLLCWWTFCREVEKLAAKRGTTQS